MKGFKVQELGPTSEAVQGNGRRDLYKIYLISGQSTLHYLERSICLKGTYLFFGNPYLSYSSEVGPGAQTGYACLFTDEFLRADSQLAGLQQSPLFKVGGPPVALRPEQSTYLTGLFHRMLVEQQSTYLHKEHLLHTCVRLLVLEGLRLQAPVTELAFRCYCRPRDAAGAVGSRWQLRRAPGR